MFEDLQRVRANNIIFYIAINNFIASLGVLLGSVPTGSASCWFQGLTSNINYLSSALWSTMITYQLYMICVKRTNVYISNNVHILCWGLPILVGLLPLTTNTYGNPDENIANGGWCFITATSTSPSYGNLLWYILSFYIWLWLCIATMLVLLILVIVHVKENQPIIKDALLKTFMYPVVFLICWIPSSIADFLSVADNTNDYTSQAVYFLGTDLPILQGFFLCLVFLSNKVVQEQYSMLFKSIRNGRNSLDEGDSVIRVFRPQNEYNYDDSSDTSNDNDAIFTAIKRGTSMIRRSSARLTDISKNFSNLGAATDSRENRDRNNSTIELAINNPVSNNTAAAAAATTIRPSIGV